MNSNATPDATAVTRYAARWVLPVTSAPICDGALLVVDGRIAEVGPAAAVPSPESALHVDLGNAALLPGLVNVHAHPELAILRGALEDLPFHEWIPRLRRLKLAAGCTPEDWACAARWTCAESAAAGITTLGATEDSDAAVHALRDAGMRGVAYREVFGPAPADATAAVAGLRAAVDSMRELETDLVHVGVSPHAPYTVSDALFAAVADYARAEALPVAVQTAESETEQRLVTAGDGSFAAGLRKRGIETPSRATSTVELLHRTGILDLSPLLIHCVRIDDSDIARIVAAGATIAHCPVANARLGHGIAPVTELLAAGAIVGIGSDSVASNNRIDMLEEARIAQIMQRARNHSPTALPADALLRMTTIDGARALGLADRIGSLEIGKDADLCAVSFDATHTMPLFDPVPALFMSARGTDVMLTVVRGRVIYARDESDTRMQEYERQLCELGDRVRRAGTSTGAQADLQ
jgi:5-methylthioadenosine/S-adenosylhomocysteine deaminase